MPLALAAGRELQHAGIDVGDRDELARVHRDVVVGQRAGTRQRRDLHGQQRIAVGVAEAEVGCRKGAGHILAGRDGTVGARRRGVDADHSGRRGEHLFQHAVRIHVDGSDAQAQAELGVTRREGRAFRAPDFARQEWDLDIGEYAVARVGLPDVGDRIRNGAIRIGRLTLSASVTPAIDARSNWPASVMGPPCLMSRRGLPRAQGLVVQAEILRENHRYVGELQPLDVLERIGSIGADEVGDVMMSPIAC